MLNRYSFIVMAMIVTACNSNPLNSVLREIENEAFLERTCEIEVLSTFPSREELEAEYLRLYLDEHNSLRDEQVLSLDSQESLIAAQASASANKKLSEQTIEARSMCSVHSLKLEEKIYEALRMGATEPQVLLMRADGFKRADLESVLE